MENKKLVVDSSGLNPFQYSIRNKNIKLKDLGDFFEQQNIKLYTAKETCSYEEFSYSEQGDFNTCRTYQSFNAPNETTANLNNKKYEIGENGTIIEAVNKKSELEITVISLTKETMTFKENFKNWPSPKISNEDKFSILLAETLNAEISAILANDQKLRKHAKRLEISTHGSSALLASMVISNIYSYQKGTSVYYFWQIKNPGWVPKGFTFKDVLNTEKDKIKNNKSFFINQ